MRSREHGAKVLSNTRTDPEFKSRPERPHPLFDGFVAASIAVADGREPVLEARPEPVAVPVHPETPAETPTPA